MGVVCGCFVYGWYMWVLNVGIGVVCVWLYVYGCRYMVVCVCWCCMWDLETFIKVS